MQVGTSEVVPICEGGQTITACALTQAASPRGLPALQHSSTPGWGWLKGEINWKDEEGLDTKQCLSKARAAITGTYPGEASVVERQLSKHLWFAAKTVLRGQFIMIFK